MKSPFWYVVKFGRDYNCHGTPKARQCEAQPFTSRRKAGEAAELFDGHVVKVWARLPAPKLPPWVKPLIIDAGEIAVFRVERSEVSEYLFEFECGYLQPLIRRLHAEGFLPKRVDLDSVPLDVWVEAGLRAAALLRAEKRAGR